MIIKSSCLCHHLYCYYYYTINISFIKGQRHGFEVQFLFGLLPAFPFAVLAVRAEAHGHRRALSAFLVLIAFAVFFWSCAAFLAWKETHVVDLT